MRLLRTHGLAFFLYTAITAVVFLPVVRALPSTIPGGGDAYWFLWDLWWFKRALFSLGVSPFTTGLIFFPLTDVPVIAQTPYNELLAAPALLALPLTVHYNALVFASYVLSGYGVYLLVTYLTRDRVVALAAGMVFAFCSYRNVRALGHLSLLTTQWMPFFFLTGLLLWRKRTWQSGFSFGVMAALVALSSPYYIGIVLFPAVVVGIPILLLVRFRHIWTSRLWAAALAGALVFALLTVPPYLHYFAQDEEMYTLAEQLAAGAREFSADLLSWVLPPLAHPLWGRWTHRVYAGFSTNNGAETTLFVGIMPLVLALVSFFRLRRLPRAALFWQALLLVTLILSLGPTLHIAGRAVFDWLPFRFLLEVPGFYLLRIPSRFGITANLAIVVLAGLVLADLARQWSPACRWLIAMGGATLVTFNMLWAVPFPTSSTAPPDRVSLLQESPQQAVLSLPAAEFFFPDQNVGFLPDVAHAMYLQTLHERPLVSGYLARRPYRLHEPERTIPFVKRFFSQDPLRRFVQFPDVRLLPVGFWPDDIQFGNEVLNEVGIGRAVLDCRASEYPCRPAAVLLGQALGAPVLVEDRVQLYATTPARLTGTPNLFAVASIESPDGAPPMAFDAYSRGWPLSQHAAFTLTLPVDGSWRLLAEVNAVPPDAVSADLDGIPLESVLLGERSVSFHAVMPLAAGAHHLSIDCAPADSRDAASCAEGWLANPIVRLTALAPTTEDSPLATFADDASNRYSLLDGSLYEIVESRSQAPLGVWIATRWRISQETARLVAEGDDDEAPSLQITLRDNNGSASAATDHLLGQSALWTQEGTEFLDLAPLPLDSVNLQHGALALALRAPDGTSLAAAERTQQEPLGISLSWDAVDHRSLPVVLPGTAITEPLVLQAAGDPRSYTLLGASAVDAADCSSRRLITLWSNTGALRNGPSAEVDLYVHLTDKWGINLAQADHDLGQDGKIMLDGAILLDSTEIPIIADAEVRVGVWISDPETRFVPDDDRLDDGLRLRLGTIESLLATPPGAAVCGARQ